MQHTVSEDDRLDMATQTGSSLQNVAYQPEKCSVDSGTDVSHNTPLVASSAMFNSPTTLCSLSTPPSSKNTSPTGSVLDISTGHTTPVHVNVSHHEGGEPRVTALDHSRRSSFNQHTAYSFAVIDDSSACGRNTPPILLNHRTTPTYKEKGSTAVDTGKCDKKDTISLNSEVEVDPTHESTEQKTETSIRTPTEKCPNTKAPWDLLETLQPFTTNVCRQCLGNLSGSSGKKTNDWESQLSPEQLLDHYLLFGQSLQQRKLNRLVL